MKLNLSNGITTGTAATAAAKAAVLKMLKNITVSEIDIVLPSGETIFVPVTIYDDYASCRKWTVEKDDITNGIEIIARVKPNNEGVMKIIGGKGIGVVTKKGLQIPVGEKAINPVPKKMIIENIKKLLESDDLGLNIILEAPQGEEIARKTFNSRLGIEGGISIIGTKGIINPMSEEAIKETIRCEIDVKRYEIGTFVLTPGNIGEKSLQKIGINNAIIVNNFFDYALTYLKEIGAKKIILGGHPGKLSKLAEGVYNTHSKYGNSSVDIIKRVIGLSENFNTAEEISKIYNLDQLAFQISKRVKKDFLFSKISVYLFSMDGSLCGRFEDE